ncbi:expressed unknown protein (Partial), partial [Seminavis robusta]|eukprot:Sro3032_g342500.1 n/a (72) ;mRNA; r:2-217
MNDEDNDEKMEEPREEEEDADEREFMDRIATAAAKRRRAARAHSAKVISNREMPSLRNHHRASEPHLRPNSL